MKRTLLVLALIPLAGCGHPPAYPDAAPLDAPGAMDAAPSPDAAAVDAAPIPDAPPPITIDLASTVSSDGCTHTVTIRLPEEMPVSTARFSGGTMRGGTGLMLIGPRGVSMRGGPDDAFIDPGERVELVFDPSVAIVRYALDEAVDRDSDGDVAHLAALDLRAPLTLTGTGAFDLRDMQDGRIVRAELSGTQSDGVRLGSLSFTICTP